MGGGAWRATGSACKARKTPDNSHHAKSEKIDIRKNRYMSVLVDGGGGSHRRTRLRLGIPCFAGKYREIRRLRLVMRDPALASANKFKVFPSESLRIEAGNFAD
jgi:hypothetical protein